MSMLFIVVLIAFLLFFAVLHFLEPSASATESQFGAPQGLDDTAGCCNAEEFVSLGELILSDRDWEFMRREQNPALNELFVQERRAVVRHWLDQSAGRLRLIRARHVQRSRLAKDINLVAEARVFLLLFYLSLVFGVLLILVRFFHPYRSRALAQHFQAKADLLWLSALNTESGSTDSR